MTLTGEALEHFGRVFWFTLEFGVVHERGALRTYGAGLLSSFGEITEFRRAEVRPFDPAAMATFTDYEISRFQDVLFAADDFDAMNWHRLMWANDFPHSDSTWPWSQEMLKAQTAHLSEEEKALILRDNAARI